MKLNWDEPIEEEIVKRWRLFAQDVQGLKEVRVPRHFKSDGENVQLELHGFADASGIAYGAVVYLKVMDLNGDGSVTLVSSKSKLAPIEGKKSAVKVTISRLELMAASLLSRHMVAVIKALEFEGIHVNL